MGITYVQATVSGPDGEEELRFLVDSGASYTVLPHDIWRLIGLEAKRPMTFTLADGSLMERQISECYIKLAEGESHTPVVLGEPGDQALLGVVTLENMGLILNPFTRELQTMKLMLASVVRGPAEKPH